MPLFDDKDHEDDPVVEDQIENFYIGQDADREALRSKLLREYSSPESAIEDYRRGYVTDEQLNVRFTPEEVAFIKEMKDERDRADSRIETGGYSS